jgi:hypothetical protein
VVDVGRSLAADRRSANIATFMAVQRQHLQLALKNSTAQSGRLQFAPNSKTYGHNLKFERIRTLIVATWWETASWRLRRRAESGSAAAWPR